MWLVRTALSKPYTFVVMALLIAIGGGMSIRKTPTDIFPNIDIPVITVIWNYGGLPPDGIATGLTGDERILKIAVPSLVEGDAVEIVPAQKSSP